MAIQKIGPGKAALFATLAPLLSSYEAVFFLGETFNKAQITSGLIIIVGIIINTWPTSNKTIVEPTASKCIPARRKSFRNSALISPGPIIAHLSSCFTVASGLRQ
jgi:hypothetical protein